MYCPICNSENNSVIERYDRSITSDSKLINEKITTCICKNCGNVFNEDGPRKKISSFYSEQYNLMDSAFDADHQVYLKTKNIPLSDWRVSLILKNTDLPLEGNILDIGCAKGNFLQSFSKQNPKWKLFGIESSKNALKLAKQNLPNSNLIEGLYPKENFNNKFDFIVFLNVLEHLEEPNHFLQNVKANLKDDGIVFFDFPNFKLNPADLFVYDHLNHFTRETLENLLSLNGFKVIKIIESPNRVSLFVICKITTTEMNQINYFPLMKQILFDNINYNQRVFATYEQANNKFDKIGVIGLGIHLWAGIQYGKISRSKIDCFFDDNVSLIEKRKDNLLIHNITDIGKFKNLSLLFSLSPCYIANILERIKNISNKIFIPEDFQYYKKYNYLNIED